MPVILDVDDKKIAFGLTWAAITDPKKERGDAAAHARKARARFKVRIEGEHTIAYGFLNDQVKIDGKFKKTSFYSAAALFADHLGPSESGIYLHDLGDETFALVTVVHGAPYTDLVIPTQSVADQIRQLGNETGNEYPCYGDPHDALDEVTPLDLPDLVAGGTKRALLVGHTNIQIPKPVIAVVALGGILYFGWDFYEAERTRKEQEEAEASVIDPLETYHENVRTALSGGGVTPQGALDMVRAAGARQTVAAGWTLNTVTCSRKGSCIEKWTQTGGTNASFIEAFPKSHPTYSPDGKTLVNSYSVKVQANALKAQSLRQQRDFDVEVGSLFQTLQRVGMTTKVTTSAIIGLGSGVTPSDIPNGAAIAKGNIEIAGKHGRLEEVLRQLPSSVAVDEVAITRGDSLEKGTFNLKGSYYVKK